MQHKKNNFKRFSTDTSIEKDFQRKFQTQEIRHIIL